MSDLSNKISSDEIVRYLFTGLVVACGYLLATKTSPASWFEANAWATKALPGSLGVVAVLFAGYFVFQIYRGLFYPHIIIPLRAILRLSPKYSYLRQRAKRKNKAINPVSAEDVYGILRGTVLNEKYPSRFPVIATAIHMMYCSSIILLPCSVRNGDFFWITASVVLLLAAVASDVRYESMEVKIFRMEEGTVDKALESLK